MDAKWRCNIKLDVLLHLRMFLFGTTVRSPHTKMVTLYS